MDEDKKIRDYYRIYEEIYREHTISSQEISVNTGILKNRVSKYVREMHERSVLKGPFISLHPARNYRSYAAFCKFEDPMPAYQESKGIPNLTYRNLSSGDWNLLLISEEMIDVSAMDGFIKYILQGVKSRTYLSKVESCDWDRSLENMRNAVSSPKEKSTLYEEIPHIPWNEQEWLLFQKFKDNTRAKPSPILKEYKIRLSHYRTWMTELPEFARMETAFFPHGCKKYIFYDFLFESHYHKELVNILGLLPSTCAFFSVGNYLFARLSVVDREQEYDLFSFIYSLKEKGYYSTLDFALALFASDKRQSMIY